MGQVLRKATGRVTSSSPKTPTKSPPHVQDGQIPQVVARNAPSQHIEVKPENWDPKIDPNELPGSLEQKDPKYDVMLNELMGRVRTKSGGVSENG
ncbi:hypothetical protein KI387_007259, partial [Taxus chinensis]